MNNINELVHEMIMERLLPVAKLVAKHEEDGAGVNEETLKKIIAEEVKKMPAQEVVIKIRDHSGAEESVKGAHPKFKQALMGLQQEKIADLNLTIWGEASSGKTTLAAQLAEGLGLDFYYSGAALTKFDLLGYKLPDGTVVSTPFIEAWVNGGLFLLDDADRSNPQAISMINMALANGKCDFSNTGQGSIDRAGTGNNTHDEDGNEKKPCYIVFTANTPMTGASAQYSTATKIDMATRDRFAFVEVNIDEEHELKITPKKDWTKRVQKLRKVVKKLGGNIQNIVSPTMRSSFLGANLLEAGMTQEEAEEACIFKGAGKDVKTQVYNEAGLPATKVGELSGY